MELRWNRKRIALLLVLVLLLSCFPFFPQNLYVDAQENMDNTSEIRNVNNNGNLLINGSFETLDEYDWASSWGIWKSTGNPQFTVDDTVYKNGSNSVKISAEVESRGTINQRISLSEEQRDKTYNIEQWIKTDDFTGSAYFRIQVYNAAGSRIIYKESN
ncbi:MAG: hypothetical protein GX815_04165 [Clostridiales bacterium]|nr:hypothetical protein [Clostridiales bacterium]